MPCPWYLGEWRGLQPATALVSSHAAHAAGAPLPQHHVPPRSFLATYQCSHSLPYVPSLALPLSPSFLHYSPRQTIRLGERLGGMFGVRLPSTDCAPPRQAGSAWLHRHCCHSPPGAQGRLLTRPAQPPVLTFSKRGRQAAGGPGD